MTVLPHPLPHLYIYRTILEFFMHVVSLCMGHNILILNMIPV